MPFMNDYISMDVHNFLEDIFSVSFYLADYRPFIFKLNDNQR